MKQTIEDIRNMLQDGLFRDEQHIRFSLVGRLCYVLGWDIWNPAEFYTEYSKKVSFSHDLSRVSLLSGCCSYYN